MTRISGTFSETKSKVGGTTESKKTTTIFGEIGISGDDEPIQGTFDEATKTFQNPGESSSRDTKHRIASSLESK